MSLNVAANVNFCGSAPNDPTAAEARFEAGSKNLVTPRVVLRRRGALPTAFSANRTLSRKYFCGDI